MRAFFIVLLGLALIPRGEAREEAEETSLWSFLASGTKVRRCQEGSADQAQAQKALEELSKTIEALTETSKGAPAEAKLRQLLKMKCLWLAVENGEPPHFGHALSLKTWWEHGGEHWLQNFIHPMKVGVSTDLREVTILPPEPEPVLFAETAPAGGPIAPLLCSQADAECGSETRGWIERARVALLPHPKERIGWIEDKREQEREIWTECEQTAGGQYAAWRQCVGDYQVLAKRVRALPLGRTRAPRDGWLLVSGRRGHYEFCDEVRAYDLASGAAYVAQSCSALALRAGGEVDFAKTDQARRPDVRAGVVNTENLREAAWMLLLKEWASMRAVEMVDYPIPRGMDVVYEVGKSYEGATRIDGGETWNSGQTSLGWEFVGSNGKGIARGSITWPTSWDTADAHATSLLDIAERSFAEGCPPVRWPGASLGGSPGVSGRDADPATLGSTEKELLGTLEGYASHSCKAP